MPKSYIFACAEQAKNSFSAPSKELEELILEHGKDLVLEKVAAGKQLLFGQGSLRTNFSSKDDSIAISYALAAMNISNYSIKYEDETRKYFFNAVSTLKLNAHRQVWQAKQGGHGIGI